MRTPALVALSIVLALTGCVRRAIIPTPPQEQPREEPPEGMVEVNVVSEYDDQVWDMHAGGNVVCTTPCTQWLGAGQGLMLKSRDGDRLYLPDLGVEALESRHAFLIAEGTCHGKQVNGITFTTLGGMGIVTGIALTAAGCSDIERHAGMCSAGLITGGISLPLTAVAILMLIDSLPKAHVIPVLKAQAAAGQSPVTVSVAPNGVAGTF